MKHPLAAGAVTLMPAFALVLTLAPTLAPAPALAEGFVPVTGDCGGYNATVTALAEPWEDNTRLFANGAIRVAVADTVEPAAGSFHLIAIHPPYDEMGERQCHTVSLGEGVGFSAMSLQEAQAGYDPAKGLLLRLPVRLYDGSEFVPAALDVAINQASGAVSAALTLE